MAKGQIPLSLCIPTFNREHLVVGAIESALQQDVDIEILVIDNCSTDRTWDVIQSFSDPRLRMVRNTFNMGLFGNFNRCLQLSRGKYIRWLCSDDRLCANSLREEMRIFEMSPEVVLLSSPGWSVSINRKRISLMANSLAPGIYNGLQAIPQILWMLAATGCNPLNCPSGVIVRRDMAEQVGGFDALKLNMAADLDLWLRILELGSIAIGQTPACEVTDHPGQESKKLYETAIYMSDQFQLVLRWRRYLESSGCYSSVIRQLSGRSMFYALRFLVHARFASAVANWRVPISFGVTSLQAIAGLVEHFFYRLRI